jgi:cell division transport system permease protein
VSRDFDTARWKPAALLPPRDARDGSLVFVVAVLCFLACLTAMAALASTRAADGNCGASPMPSAMRAMTNQPKVEASPPAACATDHTTRPMPSSQRGPILSTSAPTGSWHKA